MTAQEKVDSIVAAIEAGHIVYISTPLRTTKIDKKCSQRFRDKGYPLFKVKGESMYLASGKKFVCIDYCAITIR